MKIVFLGTTGYHPNNRRHTASIMFPESGLILDAGTGIFRARDLIQTNQLHIFLSHVHLDHSLGLTFLFDVAFQKNLELTQVYGEAEKLQAVENHLLNELIFPAKLPLEFKPITSDGSRWDPQSGNIATVEPVPGTILDAFPLRHPGGSIGFVIQLGNRKVAYVTDTTASLDEPYLDHIRGVDVLIHECYFPDGFEDQARLTGHSCATPVAEVARECQVGELICVHVNPLDESDDPIGLPGMRRIFPNTRIANDLDEVSL